MTTAHDIIIRAYRKIGVAAHDEEITADEAATGLDALNEMMSAWELDGITLTPAFADLQTSDTFPLADKFREGTIYLLASRLAPEFAVPATFDADDFFRKMQAEYIAVAESAVDTALTYLGRTHTDGVY